MNDRLKSDELKETIGGPSIHSCRIHKDSERCLNMGGRQKAIKAQHFVATFCNSIRGPVRCEDHKAIYRSISLTGH